VLDFVQAKFAILMIFGFFLMTAEFAESEYLLIKNSLLRALRASAVKSSNIVG